MFIVRSEKKDATPTGSNKTVDNDFLQTYNPSGLEIL